MLPLRDLLFSEQVQKIIRFLIAGTSAAAVNIFILFLLVHFAHVHYLLASILSYLLSIIAGFSFQKFFAFRDHSKNRTRVQFSLYISITLLNLLLNTLLMYTLVEVFAVWYIFAQILCGIAIAITGYFGYSKLVFTTASSPQ